MKDHRAGPHRSRRLMRVRDSRNSSNFGFWFSVSKARGYGAHIASDQAFAGLRDEEIARAGVRGYAEDGRGVGSRGDHPAVVPGCLRAPNLGSAGDAEPGWARHGRHERGEATEAQARERPNQPVGSGLSRGRADGAFLGVHGEADARVLTRAAGECLGGLGGGGHP